MTGANLRISATFDLDIVLAEVVASARGLTGARYGVIVTVDESGAPQDFVLSGFTPEEQRDLFAWSGSGRLFQHLRELPGPWQLTDLSEYARSLGIASARTFSRTFQGRPLRHLPTTGETRKAALPPGPPVPAEGRDAGSPGDRRAEAPPSRPASPAITGHRAPGSPRPSSVNPEFGLTRDTDFRLAFHPLKGD